MLQVPRLSWTRASPLSNRNDEILPLHRAVLTYYWVQTIYMYPEPGGLSMRILPAAGYLHEYLQPTPSDKSGYSVVGL